MHQSSYRLRSRSKLYCNYTHTYAAWLNNAYPKGGQSVYHPTADLLMHLGVRDKVELPEYETITTALEQFRAATRPEDSHASSSEGTQ